MVGFFLLALPAPARATEFLVNTTTSGLQARPDVAALQGGGFVIVWQDDGQNAGDTSGQAIRAQRFDAAGVKQGVEFLVNTTTADNQSFPSVAALSGGGFVVAWNDDSRSGGDTSNSAIRAQRFDAAGAKQGAEFLANTTTADSQQIPRIAGLSAGGFVISWEDDSQIDLNTSLTPYRAQLFDAAGNKQVTEILVTDKAPAFGPGPPVAALSGGGFVMAWVDPVGNNIQVQRFDAAGAKQGSSFLANTTTLGNQGHPDVTALSDGGFVVSWDDDSQTGGDNSFSAVRAQRFSATGAKQGAEFLVNTTIALGQGLPSGAGLSGGGFAMTWTDTSQSNGDIDGSAIMAQSFDAAGVKQGAEFLANTTTTGTQLESRVAALSSDGFVITWTDNSQNGGDTSGTAIRADIFGAAPAGSGAPEIDVTGMNISITDGDTTPNTADDTDFGNADIASGMVSHTFTVHNLGSAILNLGTNAASLSGANAADFSVTAQPAASVAAGDQTTVAVQFDPSALGARSATLVIANNDADESPYDFSITGTGTSTSAGAPEMDVTGMGVSITDGDTTPSTADDTDFGSVAVSGVTTSHTFTIANSGTANLNLTGAPRVALSGSGDFTVTTDAATPVAASGTTTFIIRFDPSALGTLTATVSISNDDSNENPYDFAIQGAGANSLPSGSITITGTATQGQTLAADASGLADADGLGPFSYQWRRGGTNITGATASSYTLVQADVGSTLDVVVSYTDGGGTAESIASGATAPVGNINDAPTGAVTITGTATQGQTLAADASGLADADGLGPFSYQWRRAGTNITGATASSYTLVLADVGSTLDVVVSYTDGGGTAESVTSAPTAPVQGASQFTLTVTTSGPGSGTVISNPAGIDCGATCSASFATGTSVVLTLSAGTNSSFGQWSGDCTGNGNCVVVMDQNRAVDARFVLNSAGATTLFSSVLPTARSGFVNGGPITVFASVINAGSNPALNCMFTISASAQVFVDYQETDAANVPIGNAIDQAFGLSAGQVHSFIIFLSPIPSVFVGDVFPQVVCDNASVDAIPGVNTVFLSFADHPVPDILSIGATPSGDGIITVPSGSVSFMTASATNIGVGDAAGSSDTAVSVSVDSGAASLPLLLQLCETDAASQCLASSPLGTAPVSTVIGSGASFFAVFVSDQSSGGVPLDPANARVFLRFTDTGGTVRSVTSAAVTAQAPADAPVMAATLPEGRWAVTVRRSTGLHHAQAPGVLYVRKGGEAWLESGGGTLNMLLRAANGNTPGHFSGLAGKGVLAGVFEPQRSITLVDEQSSGERLDIWGVHDVRGLPDR